MNKYSDNLPDPAACSVDVVDARAVEEARRGLSTPALAERTTSLFFALADPTRFRLLEALMVGELCVCDLACVSSVSQSAVSHQLRLLRDRGLVAFRRSGQRAVYRLADDHVRDLVAIGLAHASEDRP